MEHILTNVKINNFQSTKKVSQLKLFVLKEASRKNKVNILDHEIQILSTFLKINPNCELREIQIDDQKFFDILLYILDKYERNLYEIQTVKLFLKTLTNFMEMIKAIQHNDDFSDVLTRVSHHLKREHFKQNKLIFRTGDKGDKFYIILKGKIAILVASPKKVKMSLKEYVQYLVRLKKEEEYQILENTINSNNHIFKVTEPYLDKIISNKRNKSNVVNMQNERHLLQEYGSKKLELNQIEKHINDEFEYNNKRSIVNEYLKKLAPVEIIPNLIQNIVCKVNLNIFEAKDELIVNKSFNWNRREIGNNDIQSDILAEIPNVPSKQEVNKNFKYSQTFNLHVIGSGASIGKQLKTNSKADTKHHFLTINENSLDSIYELDDSLNNLKESDDQKAIKKHNTNYPNSKQSKYASKFNPSLGKFETKTPYKDNIKQFSLNKLNSSEITSDNSDNTNKQSTASELPELIVWEYNHILTLEKGDIFGELALESVNSRRTATLITLEDSHCGVLTQEDYEDCLKDTYEKARKNNIHYVLSSTIFQGCRKVNFEKKQFNYFINIKLKQGELLIEENRSAEFIYFIKYGEYEVETSRSINEINCFIKNLGGCADSKNEDDYLCNPIFEKFCHKKLKIKISIVKDKDVIGLSDFEYDSKYIFNARLISVTGEVFKINKKFYNSICESDKVILKNSENFKTKKKLILLEKLIRIKEIKIALFRDFNSICNKFTSGTNLEYKNNFDNFNITSSTIDSKPKDTHLPTGKSKENKSLKLELCSLSEAEGKKILNTNSSLVKTPFKNISNFSPKSLHKLKENLLVSTEKSNEKISPNSNLKTVRKKNSLDFSPLNNKDLFPGNTHSKCKSRLKTPFSLSQVEFNEFSLSSPQKRCISTGSNFFDNKKFQMNSTFKLKTKIPMPGVTRRIIISKTVRASIDNCPKLKIDRKLCEVKSKIRGILEVNPVLVSDDKKIFYDVMEQILNLKHFQKKDEDKLEEIKSNQRPNSEYKFNFIDCLVVDKIVEKTKNKKYQISHDNDIVTNQTSGNYSSGDFKKSRSKMSSKSISNFNLNNYMSPIKNTGILNLKENFSKAITISESNPKNIFDANEIF